MKITSIKPLPADPSRCVVRGEGGWRVTVPYEWVGRHGLAVGETCDERVKAEADSAGRRESAMSDAMRVIRRRAIGSRQLLERLTRKGHDPAVAQAAVSQLLDRGLLDDAAYARAAAAVVRARKPTGSRLLRQKLYQKKLPSKLVESVVAEVEKTADPLAEAESLVNKKLASVTLKKCDPTTRKRRLWGLLVRRGFDGGVISRVLADKNL